MTNTEKMQLLMQLYNAIFQSKQYNSDITQTYIQNPNIPGGAAVGRWFVNGTLRGFDFDLEADGKRIWLRVLEQNPTTGSQYATMAQHGSKIVWIIDRKVQQGGFLGRVQDGVFYPSQDRATQPIQPNNAARTAAVEGLDTESLPDIHASIPDHVIGNFEDDTYDEDWNALQDFADEP